MIELRLLGGADLAGVDEEAGRALLVQSKALAALAYLTLERAHPFHRRDVLAALLWPELDQERARGALRKVIQTLRQTLGADALVARGGEEIGLARGALWCDAVEMDEAVEAGRYARVLELYQPRGKPRELLPGFFVPQAGRFEDWLELERTRLHDSAAAAAWALASRHADTNEQTIASRYALDVAELARTDERMLRRVMELLVKLGENADALYVYKKLAERLRREFDAEPSPETRALYDRIRWGRT